MLADEGSMGVRRMLVSLHDWPRGGPNTQEHLLFNFSDGSLPIPIHDLSSGVLRGCRLGELNLVGGHTTYTFYVVVRCSS